MRMAASTLQKIRCCKFTHVISSIHNKYERMCQQRTHYNSAKVTRSTRYWLIRLGQLPWCVSRMRERSKSALDGQHLTKKTYSSERTNLLTVLVTRKIFSLVYCVISVFKQRWHGLMVNKILSASTLELRARHCNTQCAV